ncbi:hypothetical protein SEMRO_162_G072680.1 [Seminavis robusta]|uniref:Uncharacterized protein n=1 Tax=Seminavis robusta TaxID=568900 RepID=A0A9N8DIK2_9STRA|nr:hypothetical protein SEMRO_162_G072680.1 [Seminavis robusta]|eukprot:Sro162_g072680.1 n/a (120) ;mRNA; f:1187-1546
MPMPKLKQHNGNKNGNSNSNSNLLGDSKQQGGKRKPRKKKPPHQMKVWRIQQYMVVTIDAANAKIIQVYGHGSVTNLIGQITRDQKNPTLQYVGSQRFRRGVLPCRNGPLGNDLGGILA